MRSDLTGRFIPESSSLFSKIEALETSRPMYMRTDAYTQLVNMYNAFRTDYPTISIPVISATRNLSYQATIWTNKWNNDYGNVTDPLQRALRILEYSSMPGSSRHHWGTDVDLYSLSNSDFNQGNGLIIYTWLTKNASKFGFFQPYIAGRCTGYYEEKWHWSFVPVSKQFLRDWNSYFQNICRWVSLVQFPGVERAGMLAPTFVNAINENCY